MAIVQQSITRIYNKRIVHSANVQFPNSSSQLNRVIKTIESVAMPNYQWQLLWPHVSSNKHAPPVLTAFRGNSSGVDPLLWYLFQFIVVR